MPHEASVGDILRGFGLRIRRARESMGLSRALLTAEMAVHAAESLAAWTEGHLDALEQASFLDGARAADDRIWTHLPAIYHLVEKSVHRLFRREVSAADAPYVRFELGLSTPQVPTRGCICIYMGRYETRAYM